jgi:hypothetical protein
MSELVLLGNSKFQIPTAKLLSLALASDECPIAGFRKEAGIDQRAKDSFARGFVKTPQTFRLLRRQSQPGHLEKFSADTPDDFLNSTSCVVHFPPVIRACGRT